ncbi:replicative DNA helicase [Luteimonas sp. 8-5]|uniref:replicative DNA helicase n=1 Tax=Luteimonas sp. 8-5 TaxID=3039387 RepID=UPI002436745D|nr:replicative DNA helicase [Luteimonas sp. 8-5]MDG6349278.1 replicative DNA helicase [Luteimonas sp. 8-5]
MSARQGFRSSNSGFEGNGFQGRADSRVEQLRVPPQSVEAEQAVLGGLMLVPDAFDRVADILADNDFYRRDHQLIYRAIRELAEKNRPYDAVTLGEWFESMGQSEQVAGGAYLVELASTTPSAANIVAYAEIVRDKAVLRQLIEVGTGIVNDGFQPDGRETSEILDAAESSVLAIAEHSAKGRMEYVTVHNALAEAFDVLQKRYESGGSVTGLPTGYTEFDEMTAGLQPTDLLILAARPSMGKCLSADSEIVLDDGSVATIEQICKARSGRLGTLDEDYRLARAEPSDFVDDGIKPTFEVVTRLGRRVETTAPHPFLTVDGWKPLHQLSVGDYVAVPRRLPVFGTEAMRECEIKLLAYLIGDGGLTGNAPRFTNGNPVISGDFGDAVAAFGGVVAREVETRAGFAPSWRVAADGGAVGASRQAFAGSLDARLGRGKARAVAAALGVSPGTVTHWRQGRTVPEPAAFARLCEVLEVVPDDLGGQVEDARRNLPNAMTRWLSDLGLMGCDSHAKQVPAPVFRLPREQLALFLNRLFATDGWATVLASGQAQVGYASVSERLARQVQHLLLRFGVMAKLRQRWVKYRDSRRCSWQLDITSAESLRIFVDEIGIHGKQAAIDSVRAALDARGQGGNVDMLPPGAWKLVDDARGELSWAELARRCGFNASNVHVGKRGISRSRLARMAMVLGDAKLAALASSDVCWDRIESITHAGDKQVYDLTVPGTHNFIANDVCVHNTTLALNMAEYAAMKSKQPVAIFSMEMSASQLALRLISSVGRINATRLRTGQLEDEDWSRVTSAIRLLREARIFIDDEPALSPEKLRAKARRIKKEHGLGLIVIDYLQLMAVPGNSENRATEISEISRSLKGLAKELNVPVIALSQLNRSLETRTDKRPMMADLRESGAIEQDADVIVFIYRDEYYNKENSQDKGLAEIIIGKQRNGPTGSIKLKFFGEYTRFDNLAHDSVGAFE